MAFGQEINFSFISNKVLNSSQMNGQERISIPKKLNLEHGEFLRVEDKFIISTHKHALILKKLKKEMRPGYPIPNVEYTLVESIYYDGPQANFFQDHFSQLEERYKVRVRRYAPNGIWSNDPYLIEIKSKKLGVCKKFRFKISKEKLEKIQNGKELELDLELSLLNQEIPPTLLQKRVKKVNKLLSKYSLRPMVSVVYHRQAFECDNFRVTLDQQLSAGLFDNISQEEKSNLSSLPFWSMASALASKYNVDKNSVLEIKYQGHIPNWFENVISEHNLIKTSFSKYCWAMVVNNWLKNKKN